MAPISRRGNLQGFADRLDPVRDAVLVDQVIQDFSAVVLLKPLACTDDFVSRHWSQYVGAYEDLSGRLREHRGYGLDGDDEPQVTLNHGELLAWAQLNKPAAFGSAMQAQGKSSSKSAGPRRS